jgi:hypothetical protein
MLGSWSQQIFSVELCNDDNFHFIGPIPCMTILIVIAILNISSIGKMKAIGSIEIDSMIVVVGGISKSEEQTKHIRRS